MRIVFSGANHTAVKAAEGLIEQGHEIILIEIDREKIDDLSDELDCSFIHGDAGKPAILEEVAPEQCDFLFCLTDNDQANIITSLLGRSMGFSRIITCIKDEDLLSLCDELGLADIVIPNRTMSQYMTNIVEGLDSVEISTLLRGKTRFFSFINKDRKVPISDLELPKNSKVLYYYRDDEYCFPDSDTTFIKDDEVVILTSSDHLEELSKKWHPQEIEKHD
ncbi:MAG: TrkA family potassium uptake protein [Desulfofustis sp.]|jgi:trk system potassium uptake protein TrkA